MLHSCWWINTHNLCILLIIPPLAYQHSQHTCKNFVIDSKLLWFVSSASRKIVIGIPYRKGMNREREVRGEWYLCPLLSPPVLFWTPKQTVSQHITQMVSSAKWSFCPWKEFFFKTNILKNVFLLVVLWILVHIYGDLLFICELSGEIGV